MARLSAQLWLAKAVEAFDSAELLLAHGYRDSASSRTYYGAFFVATALFDAQDETYVRHTRIISRFAVVFSEPGVMDRRFHRLLLETFNARHRADYSADHIPDEPAIAARIAEGREFLTAARAHLEPH